MEEKYLNKNIDQNNESSGNKIAYELRTDAQLKQIAIDIIEGRIFSHWNIERPEDVRHVFMPISLGAFAKCTDEEYNNVGLVFEYLDKAGPRTINGMPNFFSMQIVNVKDTEIIRKHYAEYEKMKDNFINA